MIRTKVMLTAMGLSLAAVLAGCSSSASSSASYRSTPIAQGGSRQTMTLVPAEPDQAASAPYTLSGQDHQAPHK